MDEEQPRNLRVPCLSTILELPEICHSQNLRLSSETNRFMVYQTLKKVGPTAVQKILSKCVEKGEIQWDKQEEFEVEQILDHRVDEDGKNFYFIKWFGWAHKHNTWEPEDNLNCPDLLKEYHENKSSNMVEDEDFRLSKKRRIDDIFERLVGSQLSNNMSALELLSMVKPMSRKPNHCKGLISCQDKKVPKLKLSHGYCNPHSKGYREKKRDVERALKEWETKLNGINTDPAPITVENKVDLEGPPDNFIYINDYRAGDGIEIPQDPLAGCECTDCYENKKSCCALFFNTHFAYYKSKRVRVPPGTPVYECNKRCQCGPNCPNRVVQFGRNIKVCIFRTANGRGWGVKTLQKIKKGTFVMEYVGEVITSEEAERRGKVYDAEGRTYLFDLDYNDGDCPFTVDAGYYGNVSHFVNHSCDPNLVVFGVWINTVDPRLPRIALFANRDIAKGEELTFDYMMTGDTTRNAGTGEKDGQEKDGEEKKEEEEQDKESGSGEEEEAAAPEAKQSFRRSRPLETEQSLQTSPEDGAEPNSKQYRMVCQCGSATCRKYLF